MADEGVQIMKAMWGPGPVTFEGQYYKVENAYCEPRFETPPTLMLGMSGERRAMRRGGPSRRLVEHRRPPGRRAAPRSSTC